MTSPIVSVAMPVYNVERYVEAAVESVLAQTYENLELLIIDDGGSDNSIELCRAFIDPRVRIISQENRGLAGARNSGIRYARGEIIAFLDSDDLWHPQKLERHLEHLRERPDVGVSFSGAKLIDERGVPLGMEQRPRLTNISARDIFQRNPVSNGSTPVIRRAVFDSIAQPSSRFAGETEWFDERLKQSEDIDCWLRIALQTDWQFEGIPGALTGYRVNAGGLSANIEAQFDSWLYVRNKVRGISPHFARRWEAAAEAFQLRYLARRAVRMRDRGLALKLTTRALMKAPVALLREPVKTATTLLAAIALRIMPEAVFAQLEAIALPGAAPAN
ncbi:glycosyltransferase family A protein [Maricaulis sp.]|uniref:glycosyltransferase family 2 protein n=1 Tax=unclassified Maricaulis TaxID=2632371 RepID=UPI001B123D6D|nr:glycosyltransferase family A protein [Maricaulis sp.]MBO6798550.1 glycosyltransferase family 2 protein [Maricaulis sp.]